MTMKKWSKPAFAVIGLEGRKPEDGEDIVRRLWEEANRRFPEVAGLAKLRDDGSLAGVWGAMTDASRAFRPWEDGFSRGLYLAGVECREDAAAPEGWTRWEVPGFEYLRVENDGPEVFSRTILEMETAGMKLAGAVQDFTDPATGQGYMCFPIRSLDAGEGTEGV